MISPETGQAVYLITGIMASGKSTVAQLLAERFSRGVHVRGDVFRRMVVSGRAEMTPEETEEATRQLHLRYRLAAQTADTYFDAGFTVVVQDVILGPDLQLVADMIRNGPLYVVVLAPGPEAVAEREATRPKKGYGDWTVEQLDHILREETPHIGLWLDTSAQTPEETVDAIMHETGVEPA